MSPRSSTGGASGLGSQAQTQRETAMFSHMTIGSNDLERSKKFYDALFTAMGGRPGTMDHKGRLVYSHNGGNLLVTKPIDGNPATISNGATIGFRMDSPTQADAWHKAGVENGGKSVEDPPGVREQPQRRMYLAYLRDPDGHKLCALHHLP
jgi:catechol 2,3-dioxygenase-like lactoylglutathione lyase family enzyme